MATIGDLSLFLKVDDSQVTKSFDSIEKRASAFSKIKVGFDVQSQSVTRELDKLFNYIREELKKVGLYFRDAFRFNRDEIANQVNDLRKNVLELSRSFRTSIEKGVRDGVEQARRYLDVEYAEAVRRSTKVAVDAAGKEIGRLGSYFTDSITKGMNGVETRMRDTFTSLARFIKGQSIELNAQQLQQIQGVYNAYRPSQFLVNQQASGSFATRISNLQQFQRASGSALGLDIPTAPTQFNATNYLAETRARQNQVQLGNYLGFGGGDNGGGRTQDVLQQGEATFQKLSELAAEKLGGGADATKGWFGKLQDNLKKVFSKVDVGKLVGNAAEGFFAALDLREVFGKLNDLATTANPFANLFKVSAAGAQDFLTKLGQISIGLESVFGLAQRAFGILNNIFGASVGQNIKLREQILSIGTTLASTTKAFDTNGREITNSTEKIKSLQAEAGKAIAYIRRASLDVAGVTSQDIIDIFQVVSTSISQVGGSIQDAARLAVKFAGGLSTLGIPTYQAPQEITSILTGNITSDSVLAKRLGIDNASITKAKGTVEGVVGFLERKLNTVAAGQALLAQGFSGILSNIQEVVENIAQRFGAPLLDPLLQNLAKFYDLLNGVKGILTDIADIAGGTLAKAFDLVAQPLKQVFGNRYGKSIANFNKQAGAIYDPQRNSNFDQNQLLAGRSDGTPVAGLASGITNVQQRLLDSVGRLGASLAKAFEAALPAIEKVVTAFAKFQRVLVDAAIQRFIDRVSASAEIFVALSGAAEAAANAVAAVFGVETLKQFYSELSRIVTIFGVVTKTVTPLTQSITGIISAISQTSGVLSLVKTLATVIAGGALAGAPIAGKGLLGAFNLIKDLPQVLGNAADSAVQNNERIKAGFEKIGVSAEQAKVGAEGLGKAIRGALVASVISFGITAIVTGLVTLFTYLAEKRKEAEELQQKLDLSRAANGQDFGQAKVLADRKASLQQELNNLRALGQPELQKRQETSLNAEGAFATLQETQLRNGSLLSEQYARRLELQNQIKNAASDENAITERRKQLQKEIADAEKQLERARKENADRLKDPEFKRFVTTQGLQTAQEELVNLFNIQKADPGGQAKKLQNEVNRLRTVVKSSPQAAGADGLSIDSPLVGLLGDKEKALNEAIKNRDTIEQNILAKKTQILKLTRELENAEKAITAEKIKQDAATSLEKFQAILAGTKQFSQQDIGSIVSDLQAKLAQSPVGTKQFEEVADKIKAAQLVAEQASKTALDRLKEQGQFEEDLQRQRLNSEIEIRNIRKQTVSEERNNLLTSVSDQAKKYLNLYEDRRSREEQLQDTIKQNAIEIASIQRKAWENAVERAKTIKAIFETIKFPEFRFQANIDTQAAGKRGLRTDVNFGIANSILENGGNRESAFGTFITTTNRFRTDPGGRSFQDLVSAPGQYPPYLKILENADKDGKKADVEAAILSGDFKKVFDLFRKYAGPIEKARLQRITREQFAQQAEQLIADITDKDTLKKAVDSDTLGRSYYQNPGNDIKNNPRFKQFRYGNEIFYADPAVRKTTLAGLQSRLFAPTNPSVSVKVTSSGVRPSNSDQDYREARRQQDRLIPANGLGNIEDNFSRTAQQLREREASFRASRDEALAQLKSIASKDPVARQLQEEITGINYDALVKKETKRIREQLIKDLIGKSPAQQQELTNVAESKIEYAQRFGVVRTELGNITNLAKNRLVGPDGKRRPGLTDAQYKALLNINNDAADAATQFDKLAQSIINAIYNRITASQKLQDTEKVTQSTLDVNASARDLAVQQARLGKPSISQLELERQLAKAQDDPDVQEKIKASANRFWSNVINALENERSKAEDELALQQQFPQNGDRRQFFALQDAVRQAGGLKNFNEKSKEEQDKLVGSALATREAQNRTSALTSLRDKRDQLELDRLQLKELTAVTNEEKAQAALERELLTLKAQGKDLTSAEQEQFKLLQVQNLELQDRINILLQLKTGFQGLFSDIGTGFAEALASGKDFFESLQSAAANFFQSLGKAINDLIAKKLADAAIAQVVNLFPGLFPQDSQSSTGQQQALGGAQPLAAAAGALLPGGLPGAGGVDAIAQAFGLGTSGDNSLPGAAANLNKAAQALLALAGIGSPVSGGGGGITNLLGGLGGLFGGGGSAVANLAAPASTGILDLVSVFAANGGVMRGGFRAFASGGIVNQPTLGLVGEGRFNEAIVPLPDGKSIPVMMRGSSSSARDYMQGQSAGSPVLNMQFETVQIMGEEYVSRSQLEEAMAQTRRQAASDGAKQGMTMTLTKLQQSPQTRRRLGI